MWLSTDGTQMASEDWNAEFVKSMGMFLNGNAIAGRNERGEEITDVSFMVYFNASETVVEATLPSVEITSHWDVVIDTSGMHTDLEAVEPGSTIPLEPRSLVVLREAELKEKPDHSVAASVAAMTTPIAIITRPPLGS